MPESDEKLKPTDVENLSALLSTRRPQVFLSGGLHSNWQDTVIEQCPNACYSDPRKHGLTEPRDYSLWNHHQIKNSDIIFAFMEAANPSGYGIAVETGLARGYGKTVILVDNRCILDTIFCQQFAMVRAVADITFTSLSDGIDFLRRLLIVG